MVMVMVVVLVMRVVVIVIVVLVVNIRWSDDMIYQCSEVPGNISRENQRCCDSSGVFIEPGGALVRHGSGWPQPQ